MEKGGGERLGFGERAETTGELVAPGATPDLEFKAVPQDREMGPAPSVEPPNVDALPTAEPTNDQVVFSEADIRTEVPVNDLNGFEDRMIAGMEG